MNTRDDANNDDLEKELLDEDLFTKDIDDIQILTPEGRKLIRDVIELRSAFPDRLDPCNAELKWHIVHCDDQFRKDSDVEKHRRCLEQARQKYDECKKAGI
ncbi:MAG TPA: hypothetical protein DCK95_02995 [Anaerolineaceae bacterium]|nr:hypothetical protein [Anaerolineaceae bacterium]